MHPNMFDCDLIVYVNSLERVLLNMNVHRNAIDRVWVCHRSAIDCMSI